MRDLHDLVVAGGIPTFAKQMSIAHKRLHEYERTVVSPMVQMIDDSQRGLTEVSLYATLGGIISRMPQSDQHLAIDNEIDFAGLKESITAAAEERPDSDLLVTAEQAEASMTFAVLPLSSGTSVPEPCSH